MPNKNELGPLTESSGPNKKKTRRPKRLPKIFHCYFFHTDAFNLVACFFCIFGPMVFTHSVIWFRSSDPVSMRMNFNFELLNYAISFGQFKYTHIFRF